MKQSHGEWFCGLVAALTLASALSGCQAGPRVVINDEVRAAAASGDAEAAFKMGMAYDHGAAGVKRDASEAAAWYHKAAKAGHADAAQSLGYCYENGYGVTQNYAEARRWYATSLDRGNAGAAHNLGYLYDLGLGVTENDRRAATLYQTAAEAGFAEAMVNLGIMYAEGQGGLRKDPVEAYAWLDAGRYMSTNKKTHNQARMLLHLMKSRDMITAEQIKLGQQRAKALGEMHDLYPGKVPPITARR